MKKLFFLFACLITAMTSFGQANTVTAKTVNVSQSLYIRGNRIDSISSDGTFTNGNSNVLVNQAAIKAYVNPWIVILDSLYTGAINDTFPINHASGTIWNIYSGNSGKTLYDKGWETGDAYIRTNPDSSNKVILKANGVSPGTYTNATVTVDSAGRVSFAASGTGGGVTKKTINVQNANYTIIQSDSNKYITVNSATTDTIKIPDDATSAMTPPINMEVYQLGSGQVFFTALNGLVSVNGKYGKTKTAAQYSKVILNKVSANNWIVSGDLDTTTGPYLTTNVGSLPALSTPLGVASAADSFTVSGFNLGSSAVVGPLTNFEFSINNSTFASTETLGLTGSSLTGQPVKIYARITSTAPSGSVGGNIPVASSGATPQSVAISGDVTSSTPTDSMRVQFDTAAYNNQAGWTVLTGSPNFNVLSQSGLGSTGTWSISSYATANWLPVVTNGPCTLPNNGTNAGTVWPYATYVMRESWFNYQNTYNSSNPQLQITGLKTNGTTYSLKITGSLATAYTGFTCLTQIHVIGSATYPASGVSAYDAQPSGVANTANYVLLTGLVPDNTGTLKIYVNPASGNSVGILSGLILYQY